MGEKFNIEMRDTCKICRKPLPNARFRTYCSTECRVKANNRKQRRSGYSTLYQRKKRDKEACIPSPDKVQCLICGKWYVQLCTHVVQAHKMTGREYREEFGLDVKKGVIPEWYRKVKGEKAIENKTFKNPKSGKKYRFVKGDKRAGRYKRSDQTIARLKGL